MDTIIKNYNETYNTAKVNELLQRIKACHEHTKVAEQVTDAMKICGYNENDIQQVIKQLRGKDSVK
jgi:hypothetical protein